jgi:hypothetical protein
MYFGPDIRATKTQLWVLSQEEITKLGGSILCFSQAKLPTCNPITVTKRRKILILTASHRCAFMLKGAKLEFPGSNYSIETKSKYSKWARAVTRSLELTWMMANASLASNRTRRRMHGTATFNL